jgi:hypothetical protein
VNILKNTRIEGWSEGKYFGILILFYFLAHGGVLFIPNAIYWDDWILFGVAPEKILNTFRQAGSIFNIAGHLHNFFLSIGPWFYKILTFFLMLGAGLALDNVLRRHKCIPTDVRFLILLFFLVLPLYWARVALIDIGYSLGYFLFFVAWAIIDKYRLLSLALFFISFNTNSLLVFFAIPFIDYYLRSVNYSWNSVSFFKFCLNKIDFLLLPFVFFFLKIIFFKPTGLYAGYNEGFSLNNLLITPIRMAFEWLSFGIPVFYVLFFILFVRWIFDKSRVPFAFDGDVNYKLIFIIGIVVFIFGAFPYWILGHTPTFSEWTSRHQLLLPLGLSLILVSLIYYLKPHFRGAMILLFLSICLVKNIATYRDFYYDWHKQQALIEGISKLDNIKIADIVIFDDRAIEINAIKRSYRSYEWGGLMATALGDEKRLGFDPADYMRYLEGFWNEYLLEPEQLRASQYIKKENPTIVKVVIRVSKMSAFEKIKSFGHPKYVLSTNDEN